MKTVGIIGGMGPETTAKFYLRLIEERKKLNSILLPQILMWSVPINFATEKDFIDGKDESDHYLAILSQAITHLETGGANFIVAPCNSIHVFTDFMRQYAHVPVLSIVEETLDLLLKKQVNKVGILATSTTIKSQLYSKVLRQFDIHDVTPSIQDQLSLNYCIKNLLAGEYNYQDSQILNRIIQTLIKKNVQAILLACTDLQLFAPLDKTIPIFDTMEILVQSTARKLSE